MRSVNNVGLFGTDFPSEKRRDRFTVLLTGGSVAAQLGQILPPPAHRYLEDALNRRYVSQNGKPFLVLNGGDGAWKQPQALILFLQYVDVLDGVVTLDGFNEHYMLSSRERFGYPANNFFALNPLATENFGDVAYRWMIDRMAGAIAGSRALRHSHAAYLVYRVLEDWVAEPWSSPSHRPTTIQSIFALPNDWSAKRLEKFQLGQYAKYTLAMDAVARQHGVAVIHFVQPVPAIGKTLTPEEIKVAGNLGYKDLYLRLTRSMLALNQQGSTVVSLLDVFQNDKESLYADPVHLIEERPSGESRGYSILARSMADSIASAWHLRSRDR